MPNAAKTFSSLKPKVKTVDARPSAASRGYDATWQKFRKWYLGKYPLCSDCMAAGYTEPAREVHHIQPLAQRPDLKYEMSNLEGLCKNCHNRKTGKQKRN